MSAASKKPRDVGGEVDLSEKVAMGEFTRAFSLDERLKAGRALRDSAPRASHGAWKRSENSRDPIDILRALDADRIQDLLPIRYGRMLQSPFAFYRGSAGVMAADLSATANSGIYVQACGDCHLMNFGVFATPERNILFDINDFDETLPAPWEWDVKRLATSFVLAARSIGLPEGRTGNGDRLRAHLPQAPCHILPDASARRMVCADHGRRHHQHFSAARSGSHRKAARENRAAGRVGGGFSEDHQHGGWPP